MKYVWLFFAFNLVYSSASPLKAETLSVATYDHLENFDKVYKLQSFTMDALKKENIEVTFHAAPFLRSAEQVQKGQIEAIFPCGPDIPKLFPDVVLIEPPVLYSHLIAVSLKGNKDFNVDNLEKMQGTSILNNLGVREYAKKRTLKLLEVADTQQAFSLLEKKRVEFILLSQDVAWAYLESHPNLKEKIQLNTEVLADGAQYFAVNKKKSYLVPKIKSAFKRALYEDLKKYPQLKAIANKNFK